MEQAFLEVEQETGLGPRDIHLLHRGKPLDAPDEENKRLWRVHPFLFEVEPGRDIRLDWEHSDCRWVSPEEIGTMETVPLLVEAWERVAAGFRVT
jgi:8-oxo-dGTP diphosphatase